MEPECEVSSTTTDDIIFKTKYVFIQNREVAVNEQSLEEKVISDEIISNSDDSVVTSSQNQKRKMVESETESEESEYECESEGDNFHDSDLESYYDALDSPPMEMYEEACLADNNEETYQNLIRKHS